MFSAIVAIDDGDNSYFYLDMDRDAGFDKVLTERFSRISKLYKSTFYRNERKDVPIIKDHRWRGQEVDGVPVRDENGEIIAEYVEYTLDTFKDHWKAWVKEGFDHYHEMGEIYLPGGGKRIGQDYGYHLHRRTSQELAVVDINEELMKAILERDGSLRFEYSYEQKTKNEQGGYEPSIVLVVYK